MNSVTVPEMVIECASSYAEFQWCAHAEQHTATRNAIKTADVANLKFMRHPRKLNPPAHTGHSGRAARFALYRSGNFVPSARTISFNRKIFVPFLARKPVAVMTS